MAERKRRSAPRLPAYVSGKQTQSGETHYYWSPTKRDRDNGCPLRHVPLGADLEVARIVADGPGGLNAQLALWRKERSEFKQVGWAMRILADMHKASLMRARDKGLSHDVSLDDVRTLFLEQRGRCAVSGLPFSDEEITEASRRPFVPSLDRIDNGKGYTLDNVQMVAAIVNISRGDWGDEAFFRMCRGVVKKNGAGT